MSKYFNTKFFKVRGAEASAPILKAKYYTHNLSCQTVADLFAEDGSFVKTLSYKKLKRDYIQCEKPKTIIYL